MKQRGFTLLELLITIAILAILATLSFSGNTDLNEKTRAESFMLELKRHITFARAKATTSDEIVILCPVDATKLAANENLSCINNWKTNQIISFIDKNNNGTYEVEDDDLLRVMNELFSSDNLKAPDRRLRFDSSGRVVNTNVGQFIYCPLNQTKHAKALTLTLGGTALYNGDSSTGCS
ncbi:GspH/FimT family pseudopilin [Pseudoalteromonas phenolica]|nr:GspH/FimT family pseudopilin [Pseudoalteromonas phenolica]MBE0354072.1 type IV fimbrial biogenesis protein FimT [Pseudoalteromonas phenolica O-BC30]RXE96384.1 prepilin-type N-terminal cleavage/methylation domain-containing protein [Pseudoalteromonas phenolica O-BC30]TMO54793.1 prepilin-type cleavage/methylation domain-containing protein [Pseudoalteromonas phenolica]